MTLVWKPKKINAPFNYEKNVFVLVVRPGLLFGLPVNLIGPHAHPHGLWDAGKREIGPLESWVPFGVGSHFTVLDSRRPCSAV